jgi:hypothetical protein
MRSSTRLLGLGVAGITAALSVMPAFAQEARTIAPICFGCRKAVGLRLNTRDRDLQSVVGINLTFWSPYRPTTGTVRGFALGIGATGAQNIFGIAAAPAYFTAQTQFTGIGVGGLGYGVGGAATGILIGGLGGGVGQDLRGIAIQGIGGGFGGSTNGIVASGIITAVSGQYKGILAGGFGVGVGGSGTGLVVGVVGAAVGGNARGIAIAGGGFGGGGSMEGLTIAGLGAAMGGHVNGITLAGLGVGVRQSANGLTIAGLGVGAGERLNGISAGGIAVTAPRIDKAAVATFVRGGDVNGLVVAPLVFSARKRDGDASATGFFVSTASIVAGHQSGVSIGVLNYARSLKGVQLGVLNIVDDGRGPRILPIVNWR